MSIFVVAMLFTSFGAQAQTGNLYFSNVSKICGCDLTVCVSTCWCTPGSDGDCVPGTTECIPQDQCSSVPFSGDINGGGVAVPTGSIPPGKKAVYLVTIIGPAATVNAQLPFTGTITLGNLCSPSCVYDLQSSDGVHYVLLGH